MTVPFPRKSESKSQNSGAGSQEPGRENQKPKAKPDLKKELLTVGAACSEETGFDQIGTTRTPCFSS